jgi:catechol 2,3-dioxygenase-like lactoylglutathione lyase family enzyme
VSDVDRAKEFYAGLGWRLDDDVAPLDGLRIVQFTPPGSAASITFGTGLTTAAPGSAGATGTSFASTADLASALRRARAAHRAREQRGGRSHLFHRPGHDEDWPAWHAAYLVAEQAGTDLPA